MRPLRKVNARESARLPEFRHDHKLEPKEKCFMSQNNKRRIRWMIATICVLALSFTIQAAMETGPADPGVRVGAASAGASISGLTVKEGKFFQAGLDAFSETQSTLGTIAGTEAGLGPRFNMDSCQGCHAFPATGGSSPNIN